MSEMVRPTIVCIMPVKNEAWILERSLSCASRWADHIVIADQCSTDGSQDIARRFAKVVLVDNVSEDYSEAERQDLLLKKAREYPSPRLLISLDADEVLTANYAFSAEWASVLRASPGTVIDMRRANLAPSLGEYWLEAGDYGRGFMDDGSGHAGTDIHGPLLPEPHSATRLKLREVKLLHYQYTDWDRMKRKHRWYECWERLNHAWRSPTDIYRQYHHMDASVALALRPVPKDWLEGYLESGIDMSSVRHEPVVWFDRDVHDWLHAYGPERFRRDAVWDPDPASLCALLGCSDDSGPLRDERRMADRAVHRWLRMTQARSSSTVVRAVDRMIRRAGR